MVAGIQFSPSDLDMVAKVIAAENREGSPREQAAIASVMRNRVISGGFGGNNIMSVLTARTKNGGFQFTPLGIKKGEPNSPYDVDPNDPVYQSARTIAQEVFSGRTKDPTSGAVNYYAPKTQKALNQPDPDFAVGRKGQAIGQHSFYGPAPQPKNPDAVEDPDAFINEHINQGAKAAAPPSAQNNPDAVDNPDAFIEQHIAGQSGKPTQGEPAPETPSARVAGEFQQLDPRVAFNYAGGREPGLNEVGPSSETLANMAGILGGGGAAVGAVKALPSLITHGIPAMAKYLAGMGVAGGVGAATYSAFGPEYGPKVMELARRSGIYTP